MITLRTLGRTKDGQLALKDPEMQSAQTGGTFAPGCMDLHLNSMTHRVSFLKPLMCVVFSFFIYFYLSLFSPKWSNDSNYLVRL